MRRSIATSDLLLAISWEVAKVASIWKLRLLADEDTGVLRFLCDIPLATGTTIVAGNDTNKTMWALDAHVGLCSC